MLNLTTEAVRIKGNTSLATEKTLDSIKNTLSNSIITKKGEVDQVPRSAMLHMQNNLTEKRKNKSEKDENNKST